MKKFTLSTIKCTFLKFYFVSLSFLMVSVGWGQYNGVGDFNKINSLNDLTDGYYVIINSGNTHAMSNSHTGTFLSPTSISISNSVITNPASSIVWKIETNGSGKTIYNEDIQSFVSYTGSSNNIQIVSNLSTDNQRWNVTYASNVFSFSNVAIQTRILQYNSGSPRFVCYTSSQQKLLLFIPFIKIFITSGFRLFIFRGNFKFIRPS